MLRGILIDPQTRTIKGVLVPPDDHKAISKLLGCDLFDVVHLTQDTRESLYIDDEGRLAYPNKYGYFGLIGDDGEPAGDLLCGRGLVLGLDPETGASVSTEISSSFLRSRVYFPESAPDPLTVAPLMHVTPWDNDDQE